MHVQASPGPSPAEPWRKDPHVAHEEHQLGAGILQCPGHLLVEILALAALSCRFVFSING